MYSNVYYLLIQSLTQYILTLERPATKEIRRLYLMIAGLKLFSRTSERMQLSVVKLLLMLLLLLEGVTGSFQTMSKNFVCSSIRVAGSTLYPVMYSSIFQ